MPEVVLNSRLALWKALDDGIYGLRFPTLLLFIKTHQQYLIDQHSQYNFIPLHWPSCLRSRRNWSISWRDGVH